MEKIVLVDDEKHCTTVLRTLLERLYPNCTIVAIFNEPMAALDYLKNNSITLLFLDIQMPKMSGFDLLDALLPVDFDIIFTTAYDRFAIKAFDYSAINYLLKPVSEGALARALLSWEQRKLKINPEQWELMNATIRKPDNFIKKIALPTGSGYEIFPLNEIMRCESANNYTNFILKDLSQTLICKTLKEVEGLLADYSFYRIHRSHLINARFVKAINKRGNGTLVMTDGKEIPVSRQKRGGLEDILNNVLRFK